MKTKALILLSVVLFFSCSEKKEKETNTSVETSKSQETEEKNTSSYFLTLDVNGEKERVEDADGLCPIELRTTKLKNGNLITTFKSDLGKFTGKEYYDLMLNFIRKSDNEKLEKGTYSLVVSTDKVSDNQKKSGVFESVNTLSAVAYKNAKLSNSLDDFEDEFYAPFNTENVVVIESVKDLGETENSTEVVSEFLQEVTGSIKFNIIKVKTQQKYSLHLTFKAVNEIRIMN